MITPDDLTCSTHGIARKVQRFCLALAFRKEGKELGASSFHRARTDLINRPELFCLMLEIHRCMELFHVYSLLNLIGIRMTNGADSFEGGKGAVSGTVRLKRLHAQETCFDVTDSADPLGPALPPTSFLC